MALFDVLSCFHVCTAPAGQPDRAGPAAARPGAQVILVELKFRTIKILTIFLVRYNNERGGGWAVEGCVPRACG